MKKICIYSIYIHVYIYYTEHFNRTPHVLSDFTFQCIDQIQTITSENTDNLLITKEAYWSAQLFTLSPFGLNKRQEFHSKNRIHYT